MAKIVSRAAFLLAAIVAPSAGLAQDPEQRITVIGAIQDPEQRITVIGATSERTEAAPAEDPADKAIPEIPVVYEDDADAPAQAQPAPNPGR